MEEGERAESWLVNEDPVELKQTFVAFCILSIRIN